MGKYLRMPQTTESSKNDASAAGYNGGCPKCGSKNVKTKYIPNGALIHSSSSVKLDNQFIASYEYDYFFKLAAKTEHLSNTCECGYMWRQKVLQ